MNGVPNKIFHTFGAFISAASMTKECLLFCFIFAKGGLISNRKILSDAPGFYPGTPTWVLQSRHHDTVLIELHSEAAFFCELVNLVQVTGVSQCEACVVFCRSRSRRGWRLLCNKSQVSHDCSCQNSMLLSQAATLELPM